MPRVAPFAAMRYDAAVVGPVGPLTAPPYDVISEPIRVRSADASPYHVVHLDHGGHPGDEGNRYADAATTLAAWVSTGALRRDPEPSYYAYEAAWPATDDLGAGRLRGVFVALSLEPWGGSVIPHEETMPGPVEDRLRLLRATATHLSPIYGIVAGPVAPLAALLERTARLPAETEVVDEEHVRHRLWSLPADEPIASWVADEDLLIADGHHRYTTALAYRAERDAAVGPGPWDTTLALIVDAGTETVPVLPYHRVQPDGPVPELDEPARDLRALLDAVSDEALRIGVITPGPSYGLRTLTGGPPAVRALHEQYLDGLGAAAETIRFTHSAAEAEAWVRDRHAVAAFILPATTPDRVRRAIQRGQRLPRKSTFFWPKPRTGLLFMPAR
jgi:uncharacterized protein (DUF1015 family)